MRMIPLFAILIQLGTVNRVESQTASDLQIFVQGMRIETDGGEVMSVAMGTGPIVIGKPTTGVISVTDCGFFAVAGSRTFESGTFESDAVVGWRAEITPVRVDGRAVTVRLHWIRGKDEKNPSAGPRGESELTLRPGESLPIDMVPLLPGEKSSRGSCTARAASLRVAADYDPIEQNDRRLVVSDLWLVERRSDGSERSQPLSVRGLPNRPIAFYFDSLVEGGVTFDIYGHVIARPESGVLDVTLETRSRLTQGGQSSQVWRQGSMRSARRVESVIRLKPDEVVDVALPRLSENESGAFANRVFLIRIRARQVR